MLVCFGVSLLGIVMLLSQPLEYKLNFLVSGPFKTTHEVLQALFPSIVGYLYPGTLHMHVFKMAEYSLA